MTRLSVSQTIPCMASLKSSCTAPLLKRHQHSAFHSAQKR